MPPSDLLEENAHGPLLLELLRPAGRECGRAASRWV